MHRRLCSPALGGRAGRGRGGWALSRPARHACVRRRRGRLLPRPTSRRSTRDLQHKRTRCKSWCASDAPAGAAVRLHWRANGPPARESPPDACPPAIGTAPPTARHPVASGRHHAFCATRPGHRALSRPHLGVTYNKLYFIPPPFSWLFLRKCFSATVNQHYMHYKDCTRVLYTTTVRCAYSTVPYYKIISMTSAEHTL